MPGFDKPALWSWKSKDGRVIYIWPAKDKYRLVITDMMDGRWESPEPVSFATLVFYLERFHDANPQLIRMINEHHAEYMRKRRKR